MQVSRLWRYPVKSLQGEELDVALLTPDGVEGDRVVHVRDHRGPLTGRTDPRLVAVPVETRAGVPHVVGHRWDSAPAAEAVRAASSPGAELAAYDGPERFDVLNLLVATDGAVERFGHDVRRLRPNLLVEGVGPDEEATWPGQALAIGDALVGLHRLRPRCIATSADPDTGQRDLDVFRRIRDVFGNQLALDAWVIRPGRVRVGDEVRLVPHEAEPGHVGGWAVGAPYLF